MASTDSAIQEKYNMWQNEDLEFYTSVRDERWLKHWRESIKGLALEKGVKAWRVTKDSVEDWPLAAAGKFFSEEVYIVLNCISQEKTSMMNFDIHCWVGKQAPGEIYKRGIYSAIALDVALDGTALVHREVQDFESKRFTNCFEDFTVLKGTSDDSVDCDLRSAYKNRLLRITGPTGRNDNICVRETALKRGALDSNDVFIVDTGVKIYVWIGKELSGNHNDKKVKRVTLYAKRLESDRKSQGITVVPVVEGEKTKNHAMYDVFPNQAKKRKPSIMESANAVFLEKKQKTMSIAHWNPGLNFTLGVAEGADICSRKMNSETVAYIVDVRRGKDGDDHLFIRVGGEWEDDKQSLGDKKSHGLIIGHYYLRELPKEDGIITIDKHPCIPITVVKEGQRSNQLNAAIGS